MTETFVTKAAWREHNLNFEQAIGDVVGRERKDRDQLLAALEAKITARLTDLAGQVKQLTATVAVLTRKEAPDEVND